MFRALQERPEALNAHLCVFWIISEAIWGAFECLGRQLSLPDSLWSVQAASCEPQTAAWSVFMITSSTQRAKWCAQTMQSSEQTADSSIEKAEDNGIFALSVVKVAPQARPKTT